MPLKIAVIDAPSNLGLRPPQAGVVPGCYKMPWALRNAGLAEDLRAVDLGCVIPPRYDPSWEPGETTRNSQGIADYSEKLAERIGEALLDGLFPIAVGGDCSILLGAGLALKRLSPHGLLFLDGHTDFRHIGNSGKVDSAEMFAADCPEPEGISFDDLAKIISLAVSKKGCRGMDITIYDPDLDPNGLCATRIASCLRTAFSSQQFNQADR